MRRFVLCATLVAIAVSASSTTVEPQKISKGIFTVEYWPGDERIAQQSLDLLQEAVQEFSNALPPGDQPIRVTVCRTLQEFQVRAGQYGRAWVGGVTRADSGVIAVKAPHLLPQKQDYRGILRHELIHVLLARNIREENSPRWFNEGIAMVVSGEYRWGGMARVAGMYASRHLIPYYNLDFAFLPAGDEVLSGDAYAQAMSMTNFLIDRLGQDKFWSLIHAMREVPFETALEETAGLTPGAFYQAWRRSLWKMAIITGAASAFSAFYLMILLLFLAWLRRRKKNRAIITVWEEEDGDFPDWSPPYEWEGEEDE